MTDYRCKLSKEVAGAGIEPAFSYTVVTASDALTNFIIMSNALPKNSLLLQHGETTTSTPNLNQYLNFSMILVRCPIPCVQFIYSGKILSFLLLAHAAG